MLIKKIALLNDEVVIQLCKFLYENKIDLNYQRPTDNAEREKFRQLNLIGEFWKI
jgi:hypothetical protein